MPEDLVAIIADKIKPMLIEVRAVLDTAPRGGAELDVPEGARYIMLSDTLASFWSEKIKKIQLLLDPEPSKHVRVVTLNDKSGG